MSVTTVAEPTVMQAIVGANPILWLAILGVVLFLLYIVVPVVEWLLDAGERRMAHRVYDDDSRRRELEAASVLPKGRL